MDGNHFLLDLRLPDILGATPESVPTVMRSKAAFSLFGVDIQNTRVLVSVVAVVMMISLDRFVRYTRWPRTKKRPRSWA